MLGILSNTSNFWSILLVPISESISTAGTRMKTLRKAVGLWSPAEMFKLQNWDWDSSENLELKIQWIWLLDLLCLLILSSGFISVHLQLNIGYRARWTAGVHMLAVWIQPRRSRSSSQFVKITLPLNKKLLLGGEGGGNWSQTIS